MYVPHPLGLEILGTLKHAYTLYVDNFLLNIQKLEIVRFLKVKM